MPQIRQAFVLGAGLGTRLRPLTEELPKPLVPIFQKPLITFALDHLAAAGVTSIRDQYASSAGGISRRFSRMEITAVAPVQLIHEPVLLETGGGIKNAESWLATSHLSSTAATS